MSMQERNNYENAYECKYRIHSVINELICVIKTNLYYMICKYQVKSKFNCQLMY